MVFPNLASRLRRLRDERRLSQDELGTRAGLTQGGISLYESGSRAPNAEILQKLASALGVSVAYIIEGTEAESPLSDPEIEILVRDFQSMGPELRSIVKDMMRRLKEYEERHGFVVREAPAKYRAPRGGRKQRNR